MTGREEEEEEKEAGVLRDRRRVETIGEGISFQMSQFHQGDSSPGSINRQACVKIQEKKKKEKKMHLKQSGLVQHVLHLYHIMMQSHCLQIAAWTS